VNAVLTRGQCRLENSIPAYLSGRNVFFSNFSYDACALRIFPYICAQTTHAQIWTCRLGGSTGAIFTSRFVFFSIFSYDACALRILPYILRRPPTRRYGHAVWGDRLGRFLRVDSYFFQFFLPTHAGDASTHALSPTHILRYMACDTLSSKVGTSRDIHRVGSIPARFAHALATLVKNATQSYIAQGTLFFLKNVWEILTHACVGEKIRKNLASLWRFLEDVPACRHGPRTHTATPA
jgi:hypothetical protein